jgi:hypothetical protein
MKRLTKNQVSILVLLLLGAIAIGFLLSDHSGTLNKRSKDFSVGDPANLSKLVITQGEQKLTISRSGNGWLVNDRFPARENLTEVFLATLNNIRVKAPAPRAFRSRLMQAILTKGIRLEAFGTTLRKNSWYVYHDTLELQGTFMLKIGSDLPYAVEIPGLNKPVAAIFRLDELYWKGKTVFCCQPQNMEWVSFENKRHAEESFRIAYEQGALNLLQLNTNKIMHSTDLIAMKDYFTAFRHIDYYKQLPAGDSLVAPALNKSTPLFVITVKLKNQEPLVVSIFPLPARSQKGSTKSTDTEYFLGTSSLEKYPFIGRYADFDGVIRNLQFFLK